MGREPKNQNTETPPINGTIQQFDILDPSGLWAPAVSRELSERWDHRPGTPQVFGWKKSTQLQAGIDPRTSQGLILFFAGIEKECLSILSRLMTEAYQCPLAAVLNRQHHDLVPVLIESNIKSVIMEPANDVPIADWCLAVFDFANSKPKH